MKDEWITWQGTARVEGEITYLRPDDKPDLNLYMDSKDVCVKEESIKIRIGATMHGLTCEINNGKEKS